MSAKAAPFILAGLYALPAVIQLAFSSVIAQRVASSGQPVQLLEYYDYFAGFYFLVFFFCVAQAPELVCRDQRYQVLPLYFTRSMGRIEYALARLGSLAVALFVVLLVPGVALFIGDVLMKPDAFKAIGDELPKALPTIPASALIALGLASPFAGDLILLAAAGLLGHRDRGLHPVDGGHSRGPVLDRPDVGFHLDGQALPGFAHNLADRGRVLVLRQAPGSAGIQRLAYRRGVSGGGDREHRCYDRSSPVPIPEGSRMTPEFVPSAAPGPRPRPTRRPRPRLCRPSSLRTLPAGTATWSPSTT
jgi:hypothetical protein